MKRIRIWKERTDGGGTGECGGWGMVDTDVSGMGVAVDRALQAEGSLCSKAYSL